MSRANMNKQIPVTQDAKVGGQGGFSLVELMIALVLGTIIVLGAVGLFMTNQRTFQLQQNLTEVQQQGGFTQSFLINDLRQIGYAPSGVAGSAPFGIIVADVTVNGIKFPASSNGAGTASDVITFTFAGAQDCGGTTSAVQVQIAESYSVDASDNLQCLGSLTKSKVALLSGVASFQVLYGMDMTSDEQPVAGRYVTADKVAGTSKQVVAVRVGYIVEQASGNPQDVSSNRGYMLLEQQLTDGTAPLDATNQVRRQFEMTVPVRNFPNWEGL